MSEFSPERRQSITDLEKGKQHMLDIVERVLPLIKMDEESNTTARELMEDIKKVEDDLALKQTFGNVKKLYEKFRVDSRVRKEDKDVIKAHMEDMEIKLSGN
jgi:hypothetical protein